MLPESIVQRDMEKSLRQVYKRLVVGKSLIDSNVSRMTIDRLKPSLRRELDRRIMVSANLIKLNRDEAISTTLRRFQGWATSIPKGGSKSSDPVEEKKLIRKELSSIRFKERRVIIDQTKKLNSSIRDIVAVDSGAIAGIWHSRHSMGYDNRPEHLKRDGSIFIIRDSWAHKKGYVKPVNGYMDEIEMVGEFVYCSCSYQYLFHLKQLPEEYLTEKGKEFIKT